MKAIWAKNIREQKNHSLAFYLKSGVTADSRLEIAASNVYRLFIDGLLIGYGPARAAHGYTRKDTYNLSQHAGRQVHIVIEVFASNINSYYIVDELPFFGAELFNGEVTVATTDDFKAYLLSDRVSKVQKYSFQRSFAESYRMEASRSNFYRGDLTLFPPAETEEVSSNTIIGRNIDYPDLASILSTEVIEEGAVSTDREKPIWKDRAIYEISDKLKGYRYDELEDYLSDDASRFVYQASDVTDASRAIGPDSYRIYRFGRSVTGFLGLKITAASQSTVYLVWDEIISSNKGEPRKERDICFYRNGSCNVIKYILAPGDYDLLTFEPTIAQYVKIIVTDGEIKVNELSMVTYENRNAHRLDFQSDDKELNDILSASANTFSQNAVDVLTDCPSRERAGWLCDSYFSGRAEKLFTGKNEIERNFLENYALAPQLKELPEGMIPMCYPGDHYDGVYIPNWSMWYIMELLNYFKNTGDADLIHASKAKVDGLVRFFRKYLNEDGLLENLENWVFIEWSRCNDADYISGVNYPSNMLYSAMLAAVSELYGDDGLRAQSEAIKVKIIEQSFNGEFFEDNAIRENGVLTLKNHLTETCQYYAFYFGTASREAFPSLFTKMVNEFGPARDDTTTYPDIARSNAIVGNYLRLELLNRYGFHAEVIRESRTFFSNMAAITGTLWEHSFESASLNHGFASIAANYIVEAITGYINVDNGAKTAFFSDRFQKLDCTVKIPVSDGELVITVKDGERTIVCPAGYEVQCR
ncbi:MAG: alpha-L-rhamnosidase-related protein [Saccharofermentanales bacterium]